MSPAKQLFRATLTRDELRLLKAEAARRGITKTEHLTRIIRASLRLARAKARPA